MRFRRRPPFALVLVAAVIPVVVAIALASGAGQTAAPLRLGGFGPAFACMTAHAPASASAGATIRAREMARVPIAVTERVRGSRAIVTVTRSAIVADEASVSRTLVVKVTAVVARRSCARGSSLDGARGTALEHAYEAALPLARRRAVAQARHRVSRLVAELTPKARAQAKALAVARATAAAFRDRGALARQALAEARSRAGG